MMFPIFRELSEMSGWKSQALSIFNYAYTHLPYVFGLPIYFTADFCDFIVIYKTLYFPIHQENQTQTNPTLHKL